jgi:hypothetical protein
MSKPDGPGVIRTSVVAAWHFGHGGLCTVTMMVRLGSGGSITDSRSPLDAYMGGDRTTLGPETTLALFHIAHFEKFDGSFTPMV